MVPGKHLEPDPPRRGCRNATFPEVVGYVGLAIAVGWLVAGLSLVTLSSGIFFLGFIVFRVWLLWVLVISFLLYRPQAAARMT
jgi:hypothetical protein